MQNALLGGLDLILAMKKEVRMKLQQDMMTEKMRIFFFKSKVGGVNKKATKLNKHDEGYVEGRSVGNSNIARRCRCQWIGVECDL
jgi:hypothetical protein